MDPVAGEKSEKAPEHATATADAAPPQSSIGDHPTNVESLHTHVSSSTTATMVRSTAIVSKALVGEAPPETPNTATINDSTHLVSFTSSSSPPGAATVIDVAGGSLVDLEAEELGAPRTEDIVDEIAADSPASVGHGGATVVAHEKVFSFYQSARLVFKLSVPSIVGMALSYLAQSICIMFVGHMLTPADLSGISVALYFLWMIGIFPSMGISCAVDTLCSQEYGRDKRSTMLGVYARRGLLVNVAFAIPVTIVAVNSEGILTIMFDDEMSRLAGVWLTVSILYLFPQVCTMILAKFAQTQCRPGVPMKAQALATLSTPLWNLMLIRYGLRGSCLALAAVSWVQLAVLMLLIFRDEQLRHTWGVGEDTTKGHRPWREDLQLVTSMEGMKEYIRLAAPSMLFLGMEGAAFDGTVMVSGYMGPTYAAAWTILLQLQSSGWSSTYGISTGVAARIGNALGENRPLQAKRFGQVSIGLVTLASGFNSMVFIALHVPILYLFTDDPKITEQMYKIVPYIPLMHMSDCIQFVFQGIYAGAGKNHIGAPILLFFLWVIGLPLGSFLATTGGMTLLGLLLGMSIAMVIEIPVFIYFMNRFQWVAMASKASKQPPAATK